MGKMRFYAGCWRLSILVLGFMPLWTHGVSLVANVTGSESQANLSSPSQALRAGRRPRGWEEAGSGLAGDPTPRPEYPEFVIDSTDEDHMINLVLTEIPPSHTSIDTDPTWHSPQDRQAPVLDLDLNRTPQSPRPPPVQPQSHPEVLTVDYVDPGIYQRELRPPSAERDNPELQGAEPTSWLTDVYDYYVFADGHPTMKTYREEESISTTGVEDENLPKQATPPSAPFAPADVLSAGSGRNEEPRHPPHGVGATSGSACRLGYVRNNGTCRSPCDLFPSYCLNGGQCYLVEGMGVFCRCNVQDYIWHKGSRCESVITEFQVMCIAVGAAALLVLLLIMITVFFGKKLHLLKTENSRLRKRSKYRPTSEQPNDNFSLSTIAEGSHPNKTMNKYAWECKTKEEPDYEDDPNAQNKLEDPVKAPPPKEDEPLNIQNSLTPKHENNKVAGEENADVNSLQNNMM